MQLVETVIGRAADKQGVQVCALVALKISPTRHAADKQGVQVCALVAGARGCSMHVPRRVANEGGQYCTFGWPILYLYCTCAWHIVYLRVA